ncbi:hypothetical protein ACP275_08G251100 [Erythranthe tilingii]
MAKKRKSDSTRLDEVDRSMYTAFCSGANSLSQLYSQAMHQQRLSFQDGERHAMEKLYNLILRQQENGVRVTANDVLAYVENELDYGIEEPQSQTALQPTHSGIPVSSSNSVGPATVGQGFRSGQVTEQSRNSVFSSALSSPVRRSLQHYHLPQGGQQNRDSNPPGSNDTSMDMHPDSPGNDSPC